MIGTIKVLACLYVSLVSWTPCAFAQAKPVMRAEAEGLDMHLARYSDAGFKDVKVALGVKGTYFAPNQVGYVITQVYKNSAADKGGLRPGDTILEVDGVPVGKYGRRLYYIWKRYKYATDGVVQLTVVFDSEDDGSFMYFYPKIKLDDVGPFQGEQPRDPSADG